MNGGKNMGKLIDKHMSDPTEKNLQRILKYSDKHPFAWMMISKEQAAYLAQQLKGTENV
jgi:succinate dehydrogenase flavin-adding protein (antitoxin of CptAB toxin-antitoxin module)